MQLYFQIKSETVTLEPNVTYDDEESFTVSDEMTGGFLLYMTYKHYDSMHHDSNPSYSVIDLYDSFEKAEENARKIAKDEDIVNNEGKKAHYPNGWGTALENVFILKINHFQEKTKWVYDRNY